MYILGYLPKANRVYLMDKAYHVVSYSLLLSVLVYQTAIVRKDLEAGTLITPLHIIAAPSCCALVSCSYGWE